MAGYTELVEQWELVENEQGISGTRAFHNDSTGNRAASLPSVGDRWSQTDERYTRTICVERVKKHFGQLPDTYIWICKYTNRPVNAQAQPMPNQEPKELPISGNLAGEFVAVEGDKPGSNFVWSGTTDPIKQQIPRMTITMSVRQFRRIPNIPLLIIAGYVGKVNSVAYNIAGTEMPVGTLLFEGIQFEEYVNNNGKKRWKVEFCFNIKLLTSYAGTENVGWQYIYDETVGGFRETTPKLYLTTDFNEMMGLEEMKEQP
jgi:hypothetical protein